MPGFTELEEAVLLAIFAGTRELAPMLEQQLERASVTSLPPDLPLNFGNSHLGIKRVASRV